MSLSDGPNREHAVQTVWAADALLGEGAMWSERQQALFWVDILGRRLHRYVVATQARQTWSFDEEITAVAERQNGKGLLVTMRQHIALFDPESGVVQRLHQPEADEPGNRFNDGKCDAQGRFWASTMDFGCQKPSGALYMLDAQLRCLRMFGGFAVTNGPTWSRDGRTLYLNDTVNGRVYAFDVDSVSGELGPQRLWLQMPPEDGFPDGMTTDTQGNIWIAHWAGGCVTCHDAVTARELTRIRMPTHNITSCAFGGPALQTLFITSARADLTDRQRQEQPLAGALFSVDLSSTGLAANLFAG